MFSLIYSLKNRYLGWRENRFLKRHGCGNWKEYNRRYDPDYDVKASRIKSFYHGYSYIYCFENYNHSVYDWNTHIDGMYVIEEWCQLHCNEKFRFDGHRVIKSSDNQWEINELGGGDHMFAAFKDEKDYILFLLRWS